MTEPYAIQNHSAPLPPSVRGAPKHMRDAIRKKQNSAAAKRSRERRKEQLTAFFARYRENEVIIPVLKARIASLVQILVNSGISIPPEISSVFRDPRTLYEKVKGTQTFEAPAAIDVEMESVSCTDIEISNANGCENDVQKMALDAHAVAGMESTASDQGSSPIWGLALSGHVESDCADPCVQLFHRVKREKISKTRVGENGIGEVECGTISFCDSRTSVAVNNAADEPSSGELFQEIMDVLDGDIGNAGNNVETYSQMSSDVRTQVVAWQLPNACPEV